MWGSTYYCHILNSRFEFHNWIASWGFRNFGQCIWSNPGFNFHGLWAHILPQIVLHPERLQKIGEKMSQTCLGIKRGAIKYNRGGIHNYENFGSIVKPK